MTRERAIDYEVAIPTFNRPEGLATKTLTTLVNGGVSMNRVTLFLSERDTQLDSYLGLAREFNCFTDVYPHTGIHDKRAYIIDQYDTGMPVLQIDDDVHGLFEATPWVKTKLRPVRNLDAFIKDGFQRCADADLYAWGVAPTANYFYMTPGRWTEGLRFIAGAFRGQYVRQGHPVHQAHVRLKEDFETSLRHWWYDGAVLRADGYAFKADFRTPGGCAAYRTDTLEEEACLTLLSHWPGLVRRNLRRDTPELLLSVRGRHAGNPPDVPPPGWP